MYENDANQKKKTRLSNDLVSDWNELMVRKIFTREQTRKIKRKGQTKSSFDAAIGRSLLMFVKVRLESERLVALAAPETLDGGMRLHVGPQVGAVGEGLVAQVAFVRLLARVRAHVALQEPRPGKGLGADGTDVGQGVSQQVHG
jgi:hypothetical protein